MDAEASAASAPLPRPTISASQTLQNLFTDSDLMGVDSMYRRGGMFARRGHSDGDVNEAAAAAAAAATAAAIPRRPSVGPVLRRDSNLRHIEALSRPSERSNSGPSVSPEADLVALRRSLVLDDRQRRLATQLHEPLRPRPSSTALMDSHQPTNKDAGAQLETAGELNRSGRHHSSTMPPPPSRVLPSLRQDPALRLSQEITLPVWQPDAEVNQCPICGTGFSFWYRKHHCRKCGRVVCANCSPHRITIPRQFIVHPPDLAPGTTEEHENGGAEVVDLTGSDNDESSLPTGLTTRSARHVIDSAFGGGQEVRLCNPCVPDPNPLPHVPSKAGPDGLVNWNRSRPSDRLHQRTVSDSATAFDRSRPAPSGVTASNHENSAGPSTNATRPIYGADTSGAQSVQIRPNNASTHRRSGPQSLPMLSSIGPGSAPGRSDGQRYPGSSHHRHQYSHGQGYVHDPQRLPRPPGLTTSRTFHTPHLIPPSLRPQHQVPPRPQLREEDECPICHEALPPKGPDGSEVAREAHVAACVEARFSSSTPRERHPPPTVAIGAAIAASVATPAQASGEATSTSAADSTASTALNRTPSISYPGRRRTVGMVIYSATEKDCIGAKSGEEAECVICFEEFTIGDELGRLECLCRFHRTCIRQWWETKGPGSCPVHQQSI